MLHLKTLKYDTSDGSELLAVVFKHQPVAEHEEREPNVLIYIPGLGGTSLLALDLLEPLLLGFDTVLGLDLKGFGLNTHLGPVSPNRQLTDLITGTPHLLQQLGLLKSCKLYLAGLSLGAVMATHWATSPTWPVPWQALFLLAPGFTGHPKQFTLPYLLANLVPGVLGFKKTLQLPYGRPELTQNPRYLDDESYKEHCAALGVQKAYPRQLSMAYMLQLPDFGKSAIKACKKLRYPTVVVVPGEDKVCDPTAMVRAYENLPLNTPKQLVELPGVYHDLPLEEVAPSLGEGMLGWLHQAQLL